MASQSEKSFGARLRKLQDLVEYIKGWENYQPPRNEESLTELEKLIQSIGTINTSETTKQQKYSTNVKIRQDFYIKKSDSFMKLLVPVRAAVEAQFGKTNTEAKQVGAIVKKMRDTELVKLPADPTTNTAEKMISQSERSYGSMTQYFNDLITTIAGFSTFKTSNPEISLTALQKKLEDATAANNAVATSLQEIQSVRRSRKELYDDLAERIKRIKAYTKSQYGIKSPEYQSVINLGL